MSTPYPTLVLLPNEHFLSGDFSFETSRKAELHYRGYTVHSSFLSGANRVLFPYDVQPQRYLSNNDRTSDNVSPGARAGV